MSVAWRLIEDGPASGSWNMGVDEALLTSAVGGLATLRLYSWDGPWLSLGYGQRCDAERVRACCDAEVGLVRRATGGRAVLHGCDLTYAIAAPESAMPHGLRASYELVGEVLLASLAAVGVAATISPARRALGPQAVAEAGGRLAEVADLEGFDCFEVASEDEICLNGAKLAGSAQRRARGALLQHGSLRLRPDSDAATRAAGLAGPGATSLSEAGFRVAPEDLRAALVESFVSLLGVPVAAGPLSQAERDSAQARVERHARDCLARPHLPASSRNR